MENIELQQNSLLYKWCPFDGAVLYPTIEYGVKGWKCPEEGCPWFEPDPNAPVTE